jgi:hypothetical protein
LSPFSFQLLVRRIGIATISAVFASQPDIRLLALTAAQFSFLTIHAFAQPYRTRVANFIESFSLTVLTILGLLLLAMLNLSSSSSLSVGDSVLDSSSSASSSSFSFRSHQSVSSLFGSLPNDANEEAVLAQRIGQGCFILLYASILLVLIWGVVDIIRWRRVRSKVLSKYRLLAKSAGVISKFALKPRPAPVLPKTEESKLDRKQLVELSHKRRPSTSIHVRQKPVETTTLPSSSPAIANNSVVLPTSSSIALSSSQRPSLQLLSSARSTRVLATPEKA